MGTTPAQRSNAAWIEALRGRGDDCAAAVQELEVYLRGMLRKVLRGRSPAPDPGELLQECLTRVVEGLASFRGDSAFTTWAAAIAVRVTFTALRRQRVRRGMTAGFDQVRQEVEQLASPGTPSPQAAAARADLLAALDRAIVTQLTDRQRLAILAELRGIPTVEIAERMGTNQNALYKLTHDARKRLRAALLAEGFTAESLHDLAAGGTG